MSTSIPASHITDAHKLSADGLVDLFELTPNGTATVLRFKNDNDVTWLGNVYAGIPMMFATDGSSVDRVSEQPKLTIGQANIDLSMFKPLIFDGSLDGATVVKKKVLLTNLLANTATYELDSYRVKRIESYNRFQIVLQLAAISASMNFTLPYRQYLPPSFPSVSI